MANEILKTITDLWDGVTVPFGVVDGMEDKAHIYLVGGNVRAFIFTYEFEESWNDLTDVHITTQDFRKLMFLEDFFHPSIIIAVTFKDRMVFAKAKDFQLNKMDMIHHDGAFLPKERFKLLTKAGEKAA